MSQPPVSTIISHPEPITTTSLGEFIPEPAQTLPGRVTVLDGTPCPRWPWAKPPRATLGQAPHHRTQRASDIRLRRRTGPEELVDDTNRISNKGYIGTTRITPQRKPPRTKLNDATKTQQAVTTHRAATERAIANLKTWPYSTRTSDNLSENLPGHLTRRRTTSSAPVYN